LKREQHISSIITVLLIMLLNVSAAQATSLTVALFNGCQGCAFTAPDAKTGLATFRDNFFGIGGAAELLGPNTVAAVFTPFNASTGITRFDSAEVFNAYSFVLGNRSGADSVTVLAGHSLGGGHFLSEFARNLPFQVDLTMRLDGQCYGGVFQFLGCNGSNIGATGAKNTLRLIQVCSLICNLQGFQL